MNKLIFILLFLTGVSYCQETFKSKQFNFVIDKPNNWTEASNDELIENLGKYNLNDEKLSKLLKDNKNSLLLTSYYKYNPRTHAGLIPTIQIQVRPKSGKADFKLFKSAIVQSINGMKQAFPDFQTIGQPKEVFISGVKSVYVIGKFSMKTQRGQLLKVRTRIYAIPYMNYFIQMSFTDGQTEEDCSVEFDNLIKSVKISK